MPAPETTTTFLAFATRRLTSASVRRAPKVEGAPASERLRRVIGMVKVAR